MENREREAIFGSLIPREGFHGVERDGLGHFVWTRGRFGLRLPVPVRYLALRMCYYGRQGRLTVSRNGVGLAGIRLLEGWHTYPLDLSRSLEGDFHLELNHLIPVPGDGRDLGVMIREISILGGRESHDRLRRVLTNRELNETEYAAGRTILRSFPPNLRINVVDKCNMRPSCSYCEWSWVRNRERPAWTGFTVDTLDRFGDFYRCAEDVVDCSYGEPFLNEEFGEMIRKMDRDVKRFEFTSNGSLLGPENRRLLLGRRGMIYVSLDSADGEGYRRYRNADFRAVLDNLRDLCRERREHGRLPRVAAAFIVMKSNRHELHRFIDLMEGVGVDLVKLRMLYADYRVSAGGWKGWGSGFDYRSEMVTIDELAGIGEEAGAYAADKGIDLAVESDFGEETGPEGAPLCPEPWKSLYALNRGIIPCCFTKEAVADWSPQQHRSLEEFLSGVWNGPGFQKIRSELAAGRFPAHCLESENCPIVRRSAT